jgi:hypothetical protein
MVSFTGNSRLRKLGGFSVDLATIPQYCARVMAISAPDAIGSAIEHARRQLFSRFRFGQWVRLAVVGFLASGPGGCNLQFPFRGSGSRPSSGTPPVFFPPSLADHRLLFFTLIAVAIVFGFALAIVWMYIASRMAFVLFDSVVEEECRIREFWRRRGEPAFRYFVFQLIYFAASFVVAIAIVCLAILFAFSFGLLSNPREHVLGLVLCAAALIVAFLLLGLTAIVLMVLIRDFVIPQMALENVTVAEGWARLWTTIQAEKGRFAAYLGLKLLLIIGTGIAVGIVGLMAVLALLVPFGAVGAAAIFGGQAAGLSWNLYTIAAAVAAGIVFVAVLFVVMSLISVPLVVFFPAYALHFFADRYPPLAQRLHPAPHPAP